MSLKPAAVSRLDARRVLERMLVESARLERCGDGVRSTGPTRDAIERVPAVIEQDAAAGHRRVDAPVRDSVRAHGDGRLHSERPPTDASHSADRPLVNQS